MTALIVAALLDRLIVQCNGAKLDKPDWDFKLNPKQKKSITTNINLPFKRVCSRWFPAEKAGRHCQR